MSVFVFTERFEQFLKVSRPVFVKTFFVDKHEIEHDVRLNLIDIVALLPQPSHLQRHVQVFQPLGFHDDDF